MKGKFSILAMWQHERRVLSLEEEVEILKKLGAGATVKFFSESYGIGIMTVSYITDPWS
jgi:hypothetical protein